MNEKYEVKEKKIRRLKDQTQDKSFEITNQTAPAWPSVWSRGNTNKFKILIIRRDKKDSLYGCIFKCTWNKNFLNK